MRLDLGGHYTALAPAASGLLYDVPMLRLHRLLLPGLSVAAYLFAQGTPPTLENDQVRVLSVTDQPHAKTALHEHKPNRVMIYVTAGEQEIITQDGKKTDLKFKAGDVKWSQANGMHTSEILSANPVKLIELEVKKPGDPSKTATTALDPLKVSPGVYKLEFENPQVRVMRVHFAPHQAVPQHEHVLNRAVVYLTDQHSKLTKADGTVEDSAHKAGQVSWGGPVKHIEENMLGTAVEAIVVEFKN
jgi:quercetin dioxygenase-like cupin family protein